MGAFATMVQEYLCDRLEATAPALAWETEYRIAGTPVDVAGRTEATALKAERSETQSLTCLVELEWRRADPADNTAKLFRHLDSGEIPASRVIVVQVFTEYYTLTRGGISSKRKNAEFVGHVAAERFDRLSYVPRTLALDPPKRGGEPPPNWEETVDAVSDGIASLIERHLADQNG